MTLEAKVLKLKENMVKSKKLKVRLKDDGEVSSKKKERFAQKKIKPQCMIQRPSDENIRKTRYRSMRKWWWFGPKTKLKYDSPQYFFHKPSS